MRKKQHTAEQIIAKLREAEVSLSQREKIPAASYKLGITEQTSYRWRHEYNTFRPHGSLGYRPPASETRIPTPNV